MKVKVHWIIDGVAEIEADTPEDAEKKVENELSKFMGDNKTRLAIAKETFDIEQKERSVCHFVRGQSKQVWK